MSLVLVRPAREADAFAIADVHVRAWDESYRGIAPDHVFDVLNIERRLAQWTSLLDPAKQDAANSWPIIRVAERDGEIVGFVAARPATAEIMAPRAQVMTLYVLAEAQGQGLGRALLKSIARAVSERGLSGLALGVLPENRSAIGFYQRLGGTPIGTIIDPGPVWRSEETVFVWDDLSVLIGAN